MVDCKVIQDLLPLYKDDVVSESSRELVDEHLKNCPDCKEALTKMQSKNEAVHLEVNAAEIGALKIMKKKLVKRNLIIAITSIVCTIVLIYGTFVYTTPVVYDSERFEVNFAYDGVIDIFYEGSYRTVRGMQIDDIFYLTYEGTVATRLQSWWERRSSTEYYPIRRQFSIGGTIAVDFGTGSGVVVPVNEPTNRVYYFQGCFNELVFSDNIDELRDKLFLLWER